MTKVSLEDMILFVDTYASVVQDLMDLPSEESQVETDEAMDHIIIMNEAVNKCVGALVSANACYDAVAEKTEMDLLCREVAVPASPSISDYE